MMRATRTRMQNQTMKHLRTIERKKERKKEENEGSVEKD